MEKAIVHRILRLLHIGVQLHFVFDGPKRPPKRGVAWRSAHDKSTDLLIKTLDMLGVSWHKAIAEAEADCAELQKRGIVDAVWTEDGDAFMFGCTTLIRFHYEKKQGKDSKSNAHFRVYRAEDIPKRLPGLDRDGFVLYVILNGGDYDKAGLRGFGMTNSLEAVKDGLGKSLCRTAESDLPRWREELVQYLKDVGSKAVVPATFPVWTHLRDYREPLITYELSSKWQQSKPIVEAELKPFLQEFYNFQAEKWVEWIVPMLLVRSLMQTGTGQEQSTSSYRVEIGKQKASSTVKASFLLSAATSLDMSQYSKMKEGEFYENNFRGSLETLPWILECGVPTAMEATPANVPKNPKTSKADATKTSNKSISAGTGQKRGRPRKNASQDGATMTATLAAKGNRKLAELDSNIQLETPAAKRPKLSSDGLKMSLASKDSSVSKNSFDLSTTSRQATKTPSIASKTTTTRQATIIDLVSDDETEIPKTAPKVPPSSSRLASQEKSFSLVPKSKQSDANTPRKKFFKWNFEDDFRDSD